MIRMLKQTTVMALLVLSGCATMPNGPSVLVLPSPGKTFNMFQADDMICRQWASQNIGMSTQDTATQSAVSSAAVGTVVGAAAGALIGAGTGHAGNGAAIGAGSGLLLGTASGVNTGQMSGYEAQRRYDNAYVQCMYAKGNQIPGQVQTQTYRVQRYSLPPPPPDMDSVPPDYVPNSSPAW